MDNGHRIPNTSSSAKPINAEISGASLLPYCHLDLPEKKYYDLKIASMPRIAATVRRGSQMRMEETSSTGIDPATKVIEFISTGTGNKIVK